MKAFSFVPLMITLILLAMCFSAKAARSSPDWRNAVYLPKLLLWAGLLGNIFVIPATLLLWQQKWSHLWFVGLCLLGWALELAYANCWVKFSERGFTHHTFWGRTYEYTYLDITDIRLSSDVKLYCGRHLIFLDSLCLNRDCFLRRVDSKSKNLRILPPRLKWDPYEDKVSNGKANFFALLLTCVGFAGIFIFCCFAFFAPPESEQTTVRTQTVFRSWEKKKDTLYLTAQDGREFKLSLYESLPVDPDEICDCSTLYTLWTPDAQSPWIEQLEGQAGPLFTFEEKKAAYQHNQCWALIALGLVWLTSLYVFILSVRVGRNPERYKPWLWNLFFRSMH